jgi:hypothetical protein
MPIRKFRTPAEAGKPVKLQPGSEDFSRALRNTFRLAAIFAPSQAFPPGVFKFRSIEQAQAQRKAWIRDTIRA